MKRESESRLERPPARGGERKKRSATGVAAIVEELRSNAELRDRVTHWESMAPRPGRTTPFPERLHPDLVRVFAKRGLTEPYEHQARAIELALQGKDVLVATPTASGKTALAIELAKDIDGEI